MQLEGSHSVVLAKEESVYGTTAAPTDSANAVACRNFSCQNDVEAIKREGLAGGRAGWGSVPGAEDPNWSAECEVCPLACNAGESSTPVTARPAIHPLWIAAGMIPDFGTAGQITYNLGSSGFGSSTLVRQDKLDTGLLGHKQTLLGCRANAVLRWEVNGLWMLALKGKAKKILLEDGSGSITPVFKDYGYIGGVLTRESRLPLTGKALALSLVATNPRTGATTSFGGSALMFEADFNNEPELVYRGNGADSIEKAALVPQMGPSVDLEISAETISAWAMDTYRNERYHLDLTLTGAAVDSPSGTNDYVDLVLRGYLETYAEAYRNKRKTWKAKLQCAWATPGTPGPTFSVVYRSEVAA